MYFDYDNPERDAVRQRVLLRAWTKRTVFPWSAFKRKPASTLYESTTIEDAEAAVEQAELRLTQINAHCETGRRLAALGTAQCAVIALSMLGAFFLADDIREAAIVIIVIWGVSAVASAVTAAVASRRCSLLPRMHRVVFLLPSMLAASGPLMPIAVLIFPAFERRLDSAISSSRE